MVFAGMIDNRSYNQQPDGCYRISRGFMSWKFPYGLPQEIGNKFDEDELKLWGIMGTNSRRALWRKGRFGRPHKRVWPRHELVSRAMRELAWAENYMFRVWSAMLSKCQREAKLYSGNRRIKRN
jgi:hypothetical protein